MNQVAAGNTPKSGDINGAEDIYGHYVNLDKDGQVQGAGFSIDMSRYAMIGANPTFSSLTVTDKTDLSGNTTITDGDGTGTRTGKTLTIKMTNEIDNVSARTSTIGTEIVTVTGATTINHSGTTSYNYIGGTTLSGSTLESKTTGNTSIHADGAVGITAVGDITAVSSESDIYITANDDLSATAGDIAALMGSGTTNVGKDIEGDDVSVVTNINGKTINTRANTADTRVASAYTSAVTVSENITTENANITTLNADIETANIDIDTANTQVGEANISADTLTLSGNSLVIRETMNLNYSGGSLASTTTGDTTFVSKGNTSALTIGDTTIESNGAGKSVTLKETGVNGVVNIQTNANGGVTNIESLGDTGKININANTTNGEINVKAKSITNSATTAITKAEQANITGSTSVNISGGTINTNANTANTNATSAYTNVTSATTTIGTANTQVSSAKTVISTANTSATTATLSGNTLDIKEATSLTYSGGSLASTTNGNTTFKVSGETTIDGIKSITIQATDTTNGDVNIYAKDALTESGKTVTIIGLDNASIKAPTTTISGATTNVTGATVNISGGTGGVNVTGDTTFEDNVTIKKDLVLLHGIKHPLSWEYGSVASSVGSSYNGTEDKTITIPKTISDVASGKVSSDASGNLSVDGTITATGAIYSSDRNLKENIEFVTREDFNKAKNVAIKSFNFKDDENKNKIYGVIAQETQEAGLGELVYQKEDGHLAVDYTSLMILKIAYLEDFCAHLNGKIAELEDKLAKFENKD